MGKTRRIQDLPTIERPREKLCERGAENLKDEELIAILLGIGTRNLNAVALAKTLLRKYPLKTLATLTVAQLVRTGGIGPTKAARLIAAVELGSRLYAPAAVQKVYIRSPADTLHHVKDLVAKTQEHVVALYLNARYELIRKEIISIGNLNTVNIEPRLIFAPMLASACAIILVHNHPSGDPTPSEADIRFTLRMQEAGAL